MTTAPTPSIFEPARLGPLTLRNRIVKAATFEGVMPRGAVSDDLINFHAEVARGGGRDDHCRLLRRLTRWTSPPRHPCHGRARAAGTTQTDRRRPRRRRTCCGTDRPRGTGRQHALQQDEDSGAVDPAESARDGPRQGRDTRRTRRCRLRLRTGPLTSPWTQDSTPSRSISATTTSSVRS